MPQVEPAPYADDETRLSRYGRHFVRTKGLKEFERRLINLLVDRPDALNAEHEALFRYATVLTRMHTLRTPDGQDVSITEELDRLRGWMNELIVSLVPNSEDADVEGLRQLAPALAVRLDATRTRLLDHHVHDFNAEHLDAHVRHKKLALVLGGGGGAGLMHLGVFALLDELGYTPDLIVGSSMGSVMGALRALDRDYDPIATALALPRDISYNTIFRPFTGYSRFGFPGAFHMNLLRVAREIFHKLIGRSTLRFDELPIKLEVVTCGIRTGFQLDESEYAEEAKAAADGGGGVGGGVGDSFTPLALRRKLRLFFKVVRQLSNNPRLLAQVVFGKEEGTETFPVVEAVGFSCSVPGLLHYDVYHDDPETVRPLEEVFRQHQLLRLCDGGVVNNVPSQVAWDTIQHGDLGSRNVYILGSDVFAPISSGRNLIWTPIQRIARPNVLANKPYADYHKTFQAPPSPLQVIVNQYSRLKSIIQSSRDELADDAPYIERGLAPLPPYGIWQEDA